jgi:trimeric autotransporter adhesin
MKLNLPFGTNILRSLYLLIPACSISLLSLAQTPDVGKSYINVTKGLNGGTVETGDTLEIRASFVVRSGTFDSCGYTDAIPAGTVYIAGTVRVLTNEGKIYKQFTDAINDDPGWINGTTIRINLGYTTTNPATAVRRGRVANNHKPSFYGSACIMIASFRVRVTAALGSNIATGGGSMTYKNASAAGNPVLTATFPSNIVRVYQNFGICANTIGVNSIGTETNGTFGSGRPRNRGTSANVPVGYTFSIFTNGMPNDYYYGVANNTSTVNAYTTSNAWGIPDNSATTHRVFSVWDIIGDHTGAASPTLGNPPADTVTNNNGGYMLVINAAYRIDSAFQQTISNLCPNTYYEISCWMRNICSKCGCDSNGKGATNTSGTPAYIPTALGDSSGVYPNITFEVDGIDYFTTGNIRYTGRWIKKGFTFLTGPSQTSFTLKFFNNAPGGGGNDWALDDITVATCSPNMAYSPSINPTVCWGNSLTLYDTVRSFFNNYTYYKWQRSMDNGATWTDVTTPGGPSTPVWNATLNAWQYVQSYTVPPAATQLSDSADLYRMVVATTSSNLSNTNCRFTDGGNIIKIHVINCGVPLGVQMISFNGRLDNGNSLLNWSTGKETEPLSFIIERSTDGINFNIADTVRSREDYSRELNTYTWLERAPATDVYYRVRIRNSSGQEAYTRTIRLSIVPTNFAFTTVINPFSSELRFDVSATRNGNAIAELIDPAGRTVRQLKLAVVPGINRLSIGNTGNLAAGIYVLRLQAEGVVIQKTVMKENR